MSILGTTDSSSGSKKGNEDGDYRGDGDDGDGDDGVPNAEDMEGIARRDGAEFAVASDVQLQASLRYVIGWVSGTTPASFTTASSSYSSTIERRACFTSRNRNICVFYRCLHNC